LGERNAQRAVRTGYLGPNANIESNKLLKEAMDAKTLARLSGKFEDSVAFREALQKLSEHQIQKTSALGVRGAITATTTNTINSQEPAAKILLQNAREARTSATEANRNLGGVTRRLEDLGVQQTRLRAQEEEISKQLAETHHAFVEGFKGLVTGGGSILGGVGGFQFGVEIAKGMEDAGPWQKMGTIAGLAFVGEAVGAGIGLLIANALVGIATVVGGLIATAFSVMMNPLVFVIAIGAAIYEGFVLWEKLPDAWKDKISEYGDELEHKIKMGLNAGDPTTWQGTTWDFTGDVFKAILKILDDGFNLI